MRRTARTTGASIAALVAATLAAGGSVGGTATAAEDGDDTTRRAPSSGAVARSAVRAAVEHPGATRAGDGQAFAVSGALVDPDGTSHVRLERSYRGLPVLGGDVVVHQGGAGAWRGSSQTLDRELTLDAEPRVARAAAGRAALATRAHRSVRGERVASTRLVVDATGAAPRLAYEVVTGGVQTGPTTTGTPSRLATYVDARSGRVLRSEQQIETVDGTGRSLYGGTVPLQLTLASGTYQLKDPTRGGTYTTDMANTTDTMSCQYFGRNCKPGTLFTSADTVFGTGTTTSRESAAVDAQYGTNETWDYYKLQHGRNGIFNTGRGSFNRVHYGKNYANAFWDGSKMTYGDGDGANYGPLTSLDVAGHEMTHGVTENSANLSYSGESGGLNEATSDIFGTAVEFYATNASDPGDYLIGEEFDLRTQRGFRRMDRPSADGSSVDCWSSGVGGLDVHYSSGVGNHFFYLLAEGTGAKTFGGVAHSSTTCNGTTLTGIGRDAAAKIWYRALTVYMTSSTNYAGARTASLNAARDLYGATSTQYAAVSAAWAGVNVV